MRTDDAVAAISVRGISKRYLHYRRPADRLWQGLFGGTPKNVLHTDALRDVSFDVRRGETVGIIGMNGSGKSTLLQIICGTVTPTAGDVATRGRVAALLELGTGFDPAFTGRENVYLNAAIFGLTRAEIDERFDRIAAFADIGAALEQPVRTYSTGMVVRLAFAVVANIDADVLIVDEALAVGDAFFVQKCMRFLRGFMNRGTLLFVSHDTGTVSTLCQRALWLHKGQLILDERAPLVAETYLECLAEEAWGGEGGDERAEIIRRTALERIASRAAARAQEAAPKALDVFAPAPLPLQPLSGNLEIGARDVSGSSFGHGGARIVEVDLVGEGDEPLASLRGGEVVTLKVRVEAHAALESPIVGFVVKDRLGQALFGENTFEIYRAQPRQVLAGEMLEARFTFVAPVLAPGDYSIGVAVADGTQLQHVQHHWIHDAVIFRSVTQSVATGLMGIPMRAVTLSALSTPAR